MMEPPDSQGSSRHKTYLLSGIDPGTVTVRWKVVVDARAVVVEEPPQGLRDVAVLAVSQGVVPIDDRHAAAEHHHVVFSGIRHVLPQELIPPGDEAGDLQPRATSRRPRAPWRGRLVSRPAYSLAATISTSTRKSGRTNWGMTRSIDAGRASPRNRVRTFA